MKTILLASICFLLGSIALAQQTLLLSESFETNGEGNRYTSNSFTDPVYNCRFFQRVNASSCFTNSIQLPAGNGSYYWASEYTRSPIYSGGVQTGTRPEATVTLNPVTISGYSNLQVKIMLGVGKNSFDNNDYLHLQYSVDGGAFTTFASYRGHGLKLKEDIDLNGSADIDPGFSKLLKEVIKSLPAAAAGSSVQLRVVVSSNFSEEEIAFDNIRLLGTATINSAPTNISLSSTSVSEGQPVGTLVGNLTTTDPDAGQTHTYSLVTGTGSTGNNSFTISGNQLKTTAVFNSQVQSAYSIRVRTTDNGSPQQFYDKVFTVMVSGTQQMSFQSAMVTQNVRGTVAGAPNQQILGIKITTSAPHGVYNPLSATQFTFSTTGTTNTSNIAAAKLYYTGTGAIFDTLQLVGTATVSSSGSLNFAINKTLVAGSNNFWLSYDVAPTAAEGNNLDAALTGLVVGSPRTVANSNPFGARKVGSLSNRAFSSVNFDGINDYMDAGNNAGLILDSTFTLEAWIKPSSSITSGFAGFLGYDAGNIAQRSPGMWVYQQRRVHVGFGDGTNWNSVVTPADVLNLNEWNHVAATFDGTTLKVYANGEEVFATTAYAGRVPYSQPVRNIGRVDNYFNGMIDEISLWNRALTGDQIRQGRHLIKTGAEMGLAAYWQFNGAAGPETDPISGATATLLNGASRVSSTAPVSVGLSKRRTVSSDQLVVFEGTGVALDFKNVTGTFEVVISKLQGTTLGTDMNQNFPGVAKLATDNYWVINKYGPGTFGPATTLTYTLGAGAFTADEASHPASLKLYKRTSNSDTDWAHTNTAISADAATGSVTFDNITGFSQSMVGSDGSGGGSPLPVDLVSFTARRIDQDAVVEWVTVSETKNAGFEVQVSANGENFRKLQEVKTGAPASNQTLHYSYTDRRPNKAGKQYYRLLQYDLDGTVNNLGVRVVTFNEFTTHVSANPNPFSAELLVTIESEAKQLAEVTLTDALGRVVIQKTLKVNEGTNQLPLNTHELDNGVFILSVKLGSQVLPFRLIKL